ncbi:MAG TPA: MTAP family purine nucleoside phosphorylase, partial [Candidatus Dormibacteraeota bacterium]|nr:MTAP family purine nucleoside phosphorylase [Candidatus Dormibacteraeota bacterium]
MAEARIAVIGGSGLYNFLEPAETTLLSTPYGDPSGPITIVVVDGVSVAFLPRHGPHHTIPPHLINYRANLFALHSIGVERALAPSAVGSLCAAMAPGHLVICDQFIDRTWGRMSTYYEGPVVAHVSAADPYCAELRPLAVAAASASGFTVHERGTVLVSQGPRFGTRAEAHFHRAAGADLLNMTQYPEVVLARELGMCYVNLSLVTDYDAGIEELPERAPVSQD